jgi:hypothetical protein
MEIENVVKNDSYLAYTSCKCLGYGMRREHSPVGGSEHLALQRA